MATELPPFDDLGEAIREGRPLRPAKAYRILFAEAGINFRSVDVADPKPTGAHILTASGLPSTPDYSLFAILPSGDFEEVSLNEPFDLRPRGAERFIGFKTDREYKLTLNGHVMEWGKPAIAGTVLYGLAKAGPDEAVFLEEGAGGLRLIEPAELVDLTPPGVERFRTGPKPRPNYEIIVNSRAHVVHDKTISFEQVVKLAFPGPQPPETRYSMTYSHAASVPHAGELGPGGSVEVKKEGTVFNVTPTTKS